MVNNNYVSSIKQLKSKLRKYETKAKKTTDKNKRLNYDVLIDKYRDKIKKLVSNHIFNDVNKLSEFETKINKISYGVVVPSKVYSKNESVFRVV